MEYLTLQERLEFALTCKKNYNDYFIRIVRAKMNRNSSRFLLKDCQKQPCGVCDHIFCINCVYGVCHGCSEWCCCGRGSSCSEKCFVCNYDYCPTCIFPCSKRKCCRTCLRKYEK